ncbi:MAG: hypothetical protein M1816_005299 [Peltula sp. TS41687]|nr:MAG: hypothetical protein M1816_005299 [Peltula sp. TS41687]
MIPDSIAHQIRKLQADGPLRTTGSTATTSSSTTTASTNNLNLPPPPAYTPSSTMHLPINNYIPAGHDDGFTDDEADEYDDDEEDDRSPYHHPTTSITVTAPVKVVGHGNILNTSSLTSMLSSSLTTALQQHQTQLQHHMLLQEGNTNANTGGDSPPKWVAGRRSTHQSRPALRPLHLNVNCAVSIVGSRNVVGESVAKAAVVARMMGLTSTSSAPTAAAAPPPPPGGATAALPSSSNATGTTAVSTAAANDVTNPVVTTRKRPAESELTAEAEPPSKKINIDNRES